MQDKLDELKYLTNEIEKSLKTADKNKLVFQIKNIREVLSDIEIQLENINEEDSKISDNVSNFEVDKIVNYPHKKINSIPFLIKPIEIYGVEDIYAGNFLERFCEQRTQDLMSAGCINQHNAFWNQHQTISGNVYGCVPRELLSDNSMEQLIKLKWKNVEVDIYDFGKKHHEQAMVIDACKSKFGSFILVLEKTTGAYLAIVFPKSK